jgi:hypothetical protein
MAVASWFPLDLANVGLQRRMLASLIEARPDLGVTPEILNYLFRLKRADDLIAGVDALVERGVGAQTVNTALYALLLRRLPAPSELAMIVSRHPFRAMSTGSMGAGPPETRMLTIDVGNTLRWGLRTGIHTWFARSATSSPSRRRRRRD